MIAAAWCRKGRWPRLIHGGIWLGTCRNYDGLLAWTIHRYCHTLACSFFRTESLVGRPYARSRPLSSESASEQRPGAIIMAIHEQQLTPLCGTQSLSNKVKHLRFRYSRASCKTRERRSASPLWPVSELEFHSMEPPCSSFHPENGLKVGLPIIHPEFCKRFSRVQVRMV